jgi:hypothetical protein
LQANFGVNPIRTVAIRTKNFYASGLSTVNLKCFIKFRQQRTEEGKMSKRTMRLVCTLSDIRRAQRCTALRAAAQAAALQADDSDPDQAPPQKTAASRSERPEAPADAASGHDMSSCAG